MTTASGEKEQYDEMAVEYNSYEDLPVARLEAELISTALGDCTGLTILDLGGGSGSYARMAVRQGAHRVDVVDISEAMMQIGQTIEATSPTSSSSSSPSLSPSSSSSSTPPPNPTRINYILADATTPLTSQSPPGLLPPGSYDIAMANWLFDHARSPADLHSMWSNIATFLKPHGAGKFIGIRAIAPGIFSSHNLTDGKYGCLRSEVQEIEGGIKCRATLLTKEPFSVGCTLMRDVYERRDEVGKGCGMGGFGVVEEEGTEVVSGDREFWREHLECPEFAVVTAVRVGG